MAPRREGSISDELRIRDPEALLESGCRWMRDYLESAGAGRFIIGLSGGLDSTATAFWAARAVGAGRLTMLSLPCHTPSATFDLGAEPVERARTVAEHIPEADLRVLDIGPAVAQEAWACGVGDALDSGRWRGSSGTVFGNIQARIRAVRLRTFANARSGLVLGTGNLSERLLGYFTVGGDEQADLEVLGNLFKTHVRQMAPLLDVPPEILSAEPSADLLPGQTDRRELGFTYEEADRVLAFLLDEMDNPDLRNVPDPLQERLEASGIEGVRPNVVRRVLDRVSRTAFKRARTPRLGSVGAPAVSAG